MICNDANVVCSNKPSNGIFPEASLNIFPEMLEEYDTKFWKHVGLCDKSPNFMLFMALGGGASSGLGSKIHDHLR